MEPVIKTLAKVGNFTYPTIATHYIDIIDKLLYLDPHLFNVSNGYIE
jgi:hypothetical protein